MKCAECGTALSEGAAFCSACGAEQKKAASSEQGGGVGYSSRINDPAFKKYVKNTNRWAAIFSAVIAVVAVGSFYIMGETGYEGMENPEALYHGLGVAGMFIVIGLFTVRGRSKSTTWDGVVTDKTAKRKQHTVSYGDESRLEDYMEYSVEITAGDGKKHYIKVNDDDTLYNYYKTGDWVRHHGGLKTYEKYDKSGDSIIFCNACMSRCHIGDDYCFRCKCPLLK